MQTDRLVSSSTLKGFVHSEGCHSMSKLKLSSSTRVPLGSGVDRLWETARWRCISWWCMRRQPGILMMPPELWGHEVNYLNIVSPLVPVQTRRKEDTFCFTWLSLRSALSTAERLGTSTELFSQQVWRFPDGCFLDIPSLLVYCQDTNQIPPVLKTHHCSSLFEYLLPITHGKKPKRIDAY